MRQIWGGLDDLSPFGGVVAISWRNKGENVCNETETVVTLHQN